tara:strand:- start:660 stop:1103 length:444 start_codon:yes stop_codon:yes gene_type:complete
MISLDKSFYFSGISEDTSFIGLNIDIARKAISIDILEKRYKDFQETSVRKIKEAGLIKDTRNIFSPYKFHQYRGRVTLLLDSVKIPGNSCGLTAKSRKIKDLEEGYCFENFLRYYYCNIDNDSQADTLILLWINWVDTLKVILNMED